VQDGVSPLHHRASASALDLTKIELISCSFGTKHEQVPVGPKKRALYPSRNDSFFPTQLLNIQPACISKKIQKTKSERLITRNTLKTRDVERTLLFV